MPFVDEGIKKVGKGKKRKDKYVQIHICATLIAKSPCKNINHVDSSPLTQKLNRTHTPLFKEFEVKKKVGCSQKALERHSAVQQLNPRTFVALLRNLE